MPLKLDENQQRAVEHFRGPALVVAGPGSGKTTVIIERILRLIREHNVNPEHILAIAVTNAAFTKLEERILGELNSNRGYPEIRTLHGFGKDIITENYKRAGFNHEPEIWTGQIDKIIADERQQIEREISNTPVAIYKIESKRSGRCYIGQTAYLDWRWTEHLDGSSNDRLRQAIRSEGETQFSFEVLERVPGRETNRREAHCIASYKDREGVFNRGDPERARYSNQLFLKMFCQHFDIPYTEHLDRNPDFESLRDRFNNIKETVRRAKQQGTAGLFDPTTVNDSVAQAFAVKYETLKAEANAIDFEDMIIYAANLLKTCPDLQQTYLAKYPYLLVDESQGITPANNRLILPLLQDRVEYWFCGGDSEEHLTKTQVTASKIQNISTRLTTSVEPPKKTTTPNVKTFTDGEIVKGIVVDVNRDEVMIDIGFKSEGYIPAFEFDAGQNDLPTVQVGDEIDVYIVRREDSEGQMVLSKKIADQTLIWDEIATAYETGTPVMGRITEWIKGGLRASVGSLRGFLPASQVELRPIQNLEQYVGQTLEMKVISLSKRRHNIVLSRRAWLEAELVQKRSEILNTLKVGQSIIGMVKNITNFGGFVDLGGVDGLLHKSEMVWGHINHPSEVVSVGEEVEVKVIEFDQENGKVSLSLKQMTSDPWENVEVKYPIGSKVSGVVVNIVNYGVFVQLEEGIVGLIHVSEMPLLLNNLSPLDLLNENDELEVTVLKIFKDSQRISLSIT